MDNHPSPRFIAKKRKKESEEPASEYEALQFFWFVRARVCRRVGVCVCEYVCVCEHVCVRVWGGVCVRMLMCLCLK